MLADYEFYECPEEWLPNLGSSFAELTAVADVLGKRAFADFVPNMTKFLQDVAAMANEDEDELERYLNDCDPWEVFDDVAVFLAFGGSVPALFFTVVEDPNLRVIRVIVMGIVTKPLDQGELASWRVLLQERCRSYQLCN